MHVSLIYYDKNAYDTLICTASPLYTVIIAPRAEHTTDLCLDDASRITISLKLNNQKQNRTHYLKRSQVQLHQHRFNLASMSHS